MKSIFFHNKKSFALGLALVALVFIFIKNETKRTPSSDFSLSQISVCRSSKHECHLLLRTYSNFPKNYNGALIVVSDLKTKEITGFLYWESYTSDAMTYSFDGMSKPIDLISNFGVSVQFDGHKMQRFKGGETSLNIDPGLWRESVEIVMYYDHLKRKIYYKDDDSKTSQVDILSVKVAATPPGIKSLSLYRKASKQDELIETWPFQIF